MDILLILVIVQALLLVYVIYRINSKGGSDLERLIKDDLRESRQELSQRLAENRQEQTNQQRRQAAVSSVGPEVDGTADRQEVDQLKLTVNRRPKYGEAREHQEAEHNAVRSKLLPGR